MIRLDDIELARTRLQVAEQALADLPAEKDVPTGVAQSRAFQSRRLEALAEVRRTERILGVAIRAGLEAGCLIKAPPAIHRARRSDPRPAPRDFFNNNSKRQTEIMAMAEVDCGDFEKLLQAMMAEGQHPTRAAVLARLGVQAKTHKRTEPDEVLEAVPAPGKSRRSNRAFIEMTSTLEGMAHSIGDPLLFDPSSLTEDVLGEWFKPFDNALRALVQLRKAIRNGSDR